jgi:Rieske Fe-S protein
MNLRENCATSCPRYTDASGRFDFPLGQVRRVASGDPEVDETKRNLLKLAAVAGVLGVGVGGGVGGALQYVQPPTVGISSYPRTQLLDIDGTPLTATKVMNEYNVTTSDLYLFNYPLRNEPNFLLNLFPPLAGNGQPQFDGTDYIPSDIVGGVGPKSSIVAFSAICQHLGCPAPALAYYPLVYQAPSTVNGTCGGVSFPAPNLPSGKQVEFYIHCSCHGSTYDVSNGAANLTGPAVLPLPQVTLEWDPLTDFLYATGMTGPPVNGHLNTLQGDYSVGSTSQLEKESPVILCKFPS